MLLQALSCKGVVLEVLQTSSEAIEFFTTLDVSLTWIGVVQFRVMIL